MDAGFVSVVENGQYFMTKDNEEQFVQSGQLNSANSQEEADSETFIMEVTQQNFRTK